MLKAEQVPDEAVVSAREAWLRSDKTAHEDWRDAIAAALNAWPGLFYHPARPDEEACIFLPLPQEEKFQPYTCTRCLGATENADDLCDDCAKEPRDE